MFTRFAPLASAETEPANSSVAPLETVAVTPVPIVGRTADDVEPQRAGGD